MNNLSRIFLSLLLTQNAIWSQMVYADAPGGGSQCKEAVKKAEKKCPAHVAPLATGEATQGSINNGADQLGSEAGKAAAYGAAVTGVCEQATNECLKQCKGEEAKQCDVFKSRTQSAANETSQAASTGAEAGKTGEASGSQGGEGMNPAGAAGMLGALSGLAGMLGKKNDNKQQQQQMPMPMPQPSSPPQVQAVGAVDCNQADAYTHTECNDALVQACTNNYGESRCQSFANRYCSSATEGAGSGLGTYFCKNVNAFKFCQQSGRESCPSCLQLAANKGPNCLGNPAMCLLQQSPADIAKAKQSCPTDPAFSDPNYVNGGGALLPPSLQGGGPVVLPTPVSVNSGGGGSLNGGVTTGGSGGGSAGGVSTFSTASATQEGSGSPMASGGGSSQGSGSYGGGGSRGAYGNGGNGTNREVGAVGPAPDVQSQHGPSIFAVGTQTLRNRCQAGKLLNCP